MFRLRPQNEGLIEILPDTPPVPVSPPVSPPSASNRVDNNSTVLLSEATRGTAAARQVLSTANEAHNIAVETAERLQQQTKQLENVAMIVDDTTGVLDSAEVTIEKLTKPIWRRRIGRRKNTVTKNVDSRTVGFPNIWRKEKDDLSGERERREIVKVVDGYEEFDEVVREELVVQDELLNDASVVVEELRVLAIGIGEEIEKEAEIVEGIDVVDVTGRIRENNRRLRKRLKL